jgi:TolA-binding protein
MANYKVVYRKDLDKDRGAMLWEPGCPVLVETIQISRDTDSGTAFLQLKVQNVTGKIVNEITLDGNVTYSTEPAEAIRIQQLDCNLGSGKSIALKPKQLTHGDVDGIEIDVSVVKGPELSWKSSDESLPIPFPKPLKLDDKALEERAKLVSKKAASSAPVEGSGWWICGCGQINVGTDKCLACGAKYADSVRIQDEALLHESADNRTYQAAANNQSLETIDSLKSAEELFESLGSYRDAAQRASECAEKINAIAYERAVGEREKHTAESLTAAEREFETLGDYRDSADQAATCRKELENLRAAAALKKKKASKAVVLICSAIVILAIAGIVLWNVVINPMTNYSSAMKLYEQGDYESAYSAFTELGSYSDSENMAKESEYAYAIELYEQGDYKSAYAAFTELGGYSDSENMAKESEYAYAIELYEQGDYKSAYAAFTELGSYNDSETMAKESLEKDPNIYYTSQFSITDVSSTGIAVDCVSPDTLMKPGAKLTISYRYKLLTDNVPDKRGAYSTFKDSVTYTVPENENGASTFTISIDKNYPYDIEIESAEVTGYTPA